MTEVKKVFRSRWVTFLSPFKPAKRKFNDHFITLFMTFSELYKFLEVSSLP